MWVLRKQRLTTADDPYVMAKNLDRSKPKLQMSISQIVPQRQNCHCGKKRKELALKTAS